MARNSGDAMSSWIAAASFSASFSFVGAFMRSSWATSAFLRTRSRATFQTSDDLP